MEMGEEVGGGILDAETDIYPETNLGHT